MTKNSSPFDSPQKKADYVNAMFVRLAGRYDRMNRLMSLGRDQSWRRRAIQLAAVPPGGRLLDVAIGTGDLALAALKRDPSVRVVGIDFTIEMMQIGRLKENGRAGLPHPIGWIAGDALRLPYLDGTFDAVVSGFMMRNVTDVAAALSEQWRVVRPGGRVVCLELTYPTAPLWREMYRFIFNQILPPVNGLISGQPSAYRYLPASLRDFMSAEELKAAMEAVGLRGVGYQTMMLNTVAIHIGVK